jgi:phage I-like protein
MDMTQNQPLTGSGIGSIAIALAVAGNDPQPEQWIHMMPAGEFSARDGRGPWTLRNTDAVIAASTAYAGDNQIPVDYEHQIDMAVKNGQPVPAGWIKQLQARADGLWGLVEWTEKARAYLASKEYRYLSPVFNHAPSGEITRVLRAALTNNPALELTALANAQVANPQAIDPLSELRSLLGLAADADMPTIIQAVRNLMVSACSAKENGEENAMATVNFAIERGYLLPVHKEIALELCRSDKNKYEQYVASISPFLKALRGTQTGGLSPGQRDTVNKESLLDETAKAVCQALRHTPEEFTQLGASHAS